MWTMMMDSNGNAAQELKPPVIGRKLRPLMPRPIYQTSSCCCLPNPNILSIIGDHKREISTTAAPLVSTRWNPTPEQLQALEEMYRRGIRTPSAEQIQQIAAKLRRFGKIEGKNVFYWFQNHKARERQKKRRQLELHLAARKLHANRQPPPGLSRRYFEIELHRKGASEDSAASMHAAVCGKDGWNHKEEEIFQIHPKPKVAPIQWQFDLDSDLDLDLSSSSSTTTGQENTKPYYPYQNQTTTLHLFPSPQQETIHIPHTFTNITPTHFIEFLPIKN